MSSEKASALLAEWVEPDSTCSKMVRDILAKIAGGSLGIGDRLPTELQLKEAYGISVTSVRRGMDLLVREGLLSRRRGSGTFVRETPSLPASPRKADTILLCRRVLHADTHPYFGFRHRGLVDRLAELGWKTQTLDSQGNGNRQRLEHLPFDGPQLTELLRNRREIAGLVLHHLTPEQAVLLQREGHPCVAVETNPMCPFVDYHWEAEWGRALTLLARSGARRLWLIGTFSDELGRDLVRRAMAGLAGEPPCVEIGATPASSVYSQTTYNAYQATRNLLARGRDGVGGIAVTSDFHAQGVLDALEEAGVTEADGIRIVCLVNKESRIVSTLPYASLVSDGYAAGREAANLLHRRIVSPSDAPEYLYLSCSLVARRGFPLPR